MHLEDDRNSRNNSGNWTRDPPGHPDARFRGPPRTRSPADVSDRRVDDAAPPEADGTPMITMLSDLDLARRLEETESFASEVFALRFARRRPDVGVVVKPLAGGRAVFAGPGPPPAAAPGLGPPA